MQNIGGAKYREIIRSHGSRRHDALPTCSTELVVADVSHRKLALSDQHANRDIVQDRRSRYIGDSPGEPSAQLASGNLMREPGFECQGRIAVAHLRARQVVRGCNSDPQCPAKFVHKTLQLIEME